MRFTRHNSTAALLKTPLYDSHVKYGAKFVPYAGFNMPIMYKDQSHIDSHKWVRAKVGLFDVSHMLQHQIAGRDAAHLLQKMTPIDLSQLRNNTSSLSVLLNEQGGIIDDCIITKYHDGSYYMVTNAGCRQKDIAFIERNLKQYPGVDHRTFEGTLLAIQGPRAAEVLGKYLNYDLNQLKFGNVVSTKLSSLVSEPVQISRTGYTGEDGFELAIPSSTGQETSESNQFFQSLIDDHPDLVKPIGLAARDSLRLEAGMCLYGNELTEEITPVDASLTWLIPKTRRDIADEKDRFNGYATIVDQINTKSARSRRIGITSKGPAPRTGSKIYDANDASKQIGHVTSGLLSPILGYNIGQSYIDKTHKIGTTVLVDVRGKLREATITKLPFVANNFFK